MEKDPLLGNAPLLDQLLGENNHLLYSVSGCAGVQVPWHIVPLAH